MSANWRRNVLWPGSILVVAALVSFSYYTGASSMKGKVAMTLKEPLLIEGEVQKYSSLLPAGTTLYHDKSWPEGHSTYHVYFHFKGHFESEPANPEVIAPLWLRNVDREEVSKLLRDYPVSKDELVKILKARKMTREELAQIVREWTE